VRGNVVLAFFRGKDFRGNVIKGNVVRGTKIIPF
jgi:hypothetical protein